MFVLLNVPANKPMVSRAVERAGFRIIQSDGQWWGDAEAQAIIDAHDSRVEALADKLADVEAEAERRVGRDAPLWLQSDLTLRMVRLLAIRAGVGTGANGRQLTVAEQQEAEQIVTKLKRLQDIRQARRQIETRLQAIVDVWALLAENIAAAPEWPAEP